MNREMWLLYSDILHYRARYKYIDGIWHVKGERDLKYIPSIMEYRINLFNKYGIK